VTKKKGALLPAPENLTPEDTICIQFEIPNTPEYRYAAKYQVHELGHLGHWEYRTQPDRILAADYIRQLIFASYREGFCEDSMLRQKPTNSCILQESLDGGETWHDVFNFSRCLSTHSVDQNNQYADQQTQQLEDAYGGDITDIAPDLGYEQTIDDLTRDAAMCVALRVLVFGVAGMELERRANEYATWELVADVIRDVGLGLAAKASFWIVVGTQIAAAILDVAAGVMKALDEICLLNEDALLAVSCAMYRNLRGATITESRWQTALDDVPFTEGICEWHIANALRPLLDTSRVSGLQLFLAFHKQVQELYPLAQQGLFDACPCEDICFTFPFKDDQWGFTTTNIVYSSPGHYESGVGWVADATSLTPIGGGQYWAIHVRRTFTDFPVELVRMVFDWTLGQSDFNHTAYEIQALRDDVLIAEARVLRNDAVNDVDKLFTLEVNDTIDEIRLLVISGHFNVAVPSPTGTATIKSCEVLCLQD